jgi:hypothetical protein
VIDQIFEFSVAAGAGPTNVAPTNFNPIPNDGFIEAYAVSDFADDETALPSIQVILGGSVPSIPVPGSVIPVQDFDVDFAGPSTRNRFMDPVPVRQGTNLQVNLTGGTGATITGRIRLVFKTTDEVNSLPMQLGR